MTPRRPDIADARAAYPGTVDRAYFNTAATGLASRARQEEYRRTVDRWTAEGFDFVAGERAAEDDIARAADAFASIRRGG